VKNHAPSNPRSKPVNGLEMANQSGIASRKENESRLRRRQGACFIAFTLISFCGRLIRRPFDPFSPKKVRATQQGAIRKIRTSDNHRWAQPILDARHVKRRGSVAEAERKSGSHRPWEKYSFSRCEKSALIRPAPFRVRRIFDYHSRGGSHSLFRDRNTSRSHRSTPLWSVEELLIGKSFG
jgi:hypothetical protein